MVHAQACINGEQLKLETPRLILRSITHADASDLFECLSDKKITESMMHRNIANMQQMEKKVEEYQQELKSGFGMRCCAEKRDCGKVIGSAILYPVNNPTRAAVGFYINRAYWGFGYATEMLQEMLVYAFAQVGYNRVEADCFLDNAASACVMEHCGMICEGIARDYYCVCGEQKDVAHFAILKRDWEMVCCGR